MDNGFGFQINLHGVLSSNAFFNFVNHYKTQNNLESKPMSELTKEAAVLWSAMSSDEKTPFKRSATAVKNFKAQKQKKIVGPYKIVGYQSDLTLGKNNKLKMKEMIAYSQALKLNLKRSPPVESTDTEESQSTSSKEG